MDLPIVIFLAFCVGAMHLQPSTKVEAKSNIQAETQVHSECAQSVSDEVPIGNNLMLKKDPLAFTLILRELGLKK